MKRYNGVTWVLTSVAATGAMLAATAGIAGAETTTIPAPAPTQTAAPTSAPTSGPTTPAPTQTTGPTASVPSTGTAHLSVSPSVARPGQKVTVRLSCLGDRGRVVSSALSLGYSDGAAGSVYTDATVKSGLSAGRYRVSATCDKTDLTTTLTVRAAAPAPAPSSGQVTEVPKGSADTGDGSMAGQDNSSGTPIAVGVAALAAAGGLAGYAGLRRRSRQQG